MWLQIETKIGQKGWEASTACGNHKITSNWDDCGKWKTDCNTLKREWNYVSRLGKCSLFWELGHLKSGGTAKFQKSSVWVCFSLDEGKTREYRHTIYTAFSRKLPFNALWVCSQLIDGERDRQDSLEACLIRSEWREKGLTSLSFTPGNW